MTFQLVLSTEGKTSFASFIYEDLKTVNSFISNSSIAAEIGFGAGDESRGVKLSEKYHFLQGVHTFRIDGKVLFFLKHTNPLCVHAGNCVTGVSSADVCGVNSTSLECSGGGFTASSCICQPEALNNSKCQLTGEVTKECLIAWKAVIYSYCLTQMLIATLIIEQIHAHTHTC